MNPTISEYLEAKQEQDGSFHTQWFPRIQDIADDLVYHGEDALLQITIVETILCLPEEVAAFALAHCRFLSVGRACYGMTMPASVGVDPRHRKSRNLWLILLEERLPARDAHGTIAHAIAHAWRRDDRLSTNIRKDCEAETARLVADWGFSGRGADGDYCTFSGFRGATLLAEQNDREVR